MRNPNRLDAFYGILKEIHKENFPDWRFSQLISNFATWYGGDTFYIEEDRLIELLEKFVKELKGE